MAYGTIFYGFANYKDNSVSPLYLPATNYINSTDGKCWRYAVLPAQGQGFSEYSNGESMVWPEPLMDSITVYDNNSNPRYAVFDELKGLPYEFGTRNGPSGSGLTASYVDKASAEIPATVQFSEYMATKNHMIVEHKESHFGFRPETEDNQGDTGYGADGYRSAFTITAKLYKNGDATPTAETRLVPLESDVSMPINVLARRLALEFVTTTSEWRLINQDTDLDEKDMSAVIAMSHDTYQAALAAPIFWLSPGQSSPLTNLANGIACVGTYSALTTGPDGGTTAMSFTGTQGLTGAF